MGPGSAILVYVLNDRSGDVPIDFYPLFFQTIKEFD